MLTVHTTNNTPPVNHLVLHSRLPDILEALKECKFLPHRQSDGVPVDEAPLWAYEFYDRSPEAVFCFSPVRPADNKRYRTGLTLYKQTTSWAVCWPALANHVGDSADLCGLNGSYLLQAVSRASVRRALKELVETLGAKSTEQVTLMQDGSTRLSFTINELDQGTDMQAPAIINVTIDGQGNTLFDVEGGSGEGCKSLTSQLEKALGEVVSEETKPEYYANPIQNQLQANV